MNKKMVSTLLLIGVGYLGYRWLTKEKNGTTTNGNGANKYSSYTKNRKGILVRNVGLGQVPRVSKIF